MVKSNKMKLKEHYIYITIAVILLFLAIIEKRAKLLYVGSALLFVIGFLQWIFFDIENKKKVKKNGSIRKQAR